MNSRFWPAINSLIWLIGYLTLGFGICYGIAYIAREVWTWL